MGFIITADLKEASDYVEMRMESMSTTRGIVASYA